MGKYSIKMQFKYIVRYLVIGLCIVATKIHAQDPNFYIYLCFGQSNMEGQATIESQDKTVDSRFKVFQALDCSNLGRKKETWYTAVPPTCQCYSKLSPADYFGRTMVEKLPENIKVGIINVAVGGCDIRLFDKDIYKGYLSTYTEDWFTSKIKSYNNNPYQYLIDLAKSAQKDGIIKGMLLHQGETNTGQAAWPSYVKKIYNDILTDLSLDAKSVPLLAGEVLSADGSCCSSMNSIINKLPEAIPTAYIISSKECSGQDYAHFDSKGIRELGKRYAAKMLSLMNSGQTGKKNESANDGHTFNKKHMTLSNSQIIINYQVQKPGLVKITLFNSLGQPVKTLVNSYHNVGDFTVKWDRTIKTGNDVSKGIYYYMLNFNGKQTLKKMLIIK